jgi:hypothetical protein
MRKLPTAAEIRLKLRTERKRQLQDEKEERLLARWLLFCKGRGQTKNLNAKDKKFLLMVEHKSYDRFMSDLVLGTRTRVQPHKFTSYTPSRPPNFMAWRYLWYGSAKHNYVKHDVPKLMKMRMEMLRNGSADSQMQECGGRNMLELQRQISERERGDVDIPVSDMPLSASCEQGWHKGQKQLRERRKKTPAANRDAATVGT